MTCDIPLSCILTLGPGEAAAVSRSLEALLTHGSEDMEIVLVEHGADPVGHAVLAAHSDPRIRKLRMAPAPRGTARNRALDHGRGAWFCVLEPGASLSRFARGPALPALLSGAEPCLYAPAVTEGQHLSQGGSAVFGPASGTLVQRVLAGPRPLAGFFRRQFVRDHALAFAAECPMGGSWLFSTAALLAQNNCRDTEIPFFVGAPMPAAGPEMALAALSDAGQALHLFERSRHGADVTLRLAFLGAVFREVRGFDAALLPGERAVLRHAAALLLARLGAPMRNALQPEIRTAFERPLVSAAPWLPSALDYAEGLLPRQPRQSAVARLIALVRASGRDAG